jgi:hypothetical protein
VKLRLAPSDRLKSRVFFAPNPKAKFYLVNTCNQPKKPRKSIRQRYDDLLDSDHQAEHPQSSVAHWLTPSPTPNAPSMKSTWLLIVGVAIGVLGASSYLSNSKRPPAVTESSPNASSKRAPSESAKSRGKSLWPKWNPNKGTGRSHTISDKGSSPDPKPESKTAPSVATRPLITNAPRPVGGIEEPTNEELVVSAQRIEKHATRELERLAQLLDLTEEQQDRIFPLLARSSTAYHPALAIQVGNSETSDSSDLSTDSVAGEPSTAESSDSSEPLLAKEADEEIHDLLTDEQQDALEDELIEEDLWWSEIVADLEDELDESTQIADPTETVTESEDIEYSGNSGIGILLAPPAE